MEYIPAQHILIVEDNPGDFVLIKDYLGEEFKNPSVEHAQTFAEAKIKMSTSAHFDTILLDLSLPDASGKQLVAEMVRLAGSIPIIVLTGYADRDFGIKTLALGISDYLLKDELNAAQLHKSVSYSVERRRISTELNESEKKYRNLFDLSPIPMWVYDMETTKFLNVNEAAIEHYGYSKEAFLSMTMDDIKPPEAVAKMEEVITSKENSKNQKSIYRHLKKNGELIDVEVQSSEIYFNERNACLVLSNDITASVYQKNIVAFEKEVYDLNATGISFLEVLNKLIASIEGIMPSCLCSIVQLQEDNTIGTLAGGSMPLAYLEILNSIPIGPSVGSCGTAMFTGQNVIVPDTYTDPLWQDYVTVIEPFGFRACWSVPIKKNSGKIAGSLAAYFKEVKHPQPYHINLLERAASLVGILIDNKDAAEDITKSNERYDVVAGATSDVVWDWEIIADKIIWNKGLTAILGYTEADNTTYGNWWSQKIHPDDLGRVMDNINQHIKNRIVKWQDEYRFKAADGFYRYISDSGFLLLDKDNNATRMIGAMKDVTKQKEEEHQLKLLESVITNTNDTVIIMQAEPVDEMGPKIVYVNEAFTKMTGYTASDVIGKTTQLLEGPKSDKKELKRLHDAIKTWQGCEITVINYKKNGDEFWNNISISPVTDANGWYTHWITVSRDVTDNIKKDQEITKAIMKAQEQERSQIGAELHDNVNQILAGVLLNLGMTKVKPITEQYTWVDSSMSNIHLAISEIRKLSHRLAPVSIDDNSLKETFSTLLKSINVNNHYQINFTIKKVDELSITGDIQLNLYRILQEQLNNIMKYSKATVIDVSLLLNNEAIQLRICDNGIGFDTRSNRNGIGLGNMKKRAQLFSGNFFLKSSPGNGCEIIVEIPL
ncbi:PAS domain S-box protein [Ferruginibacter paludis]|uniref:PAS domain S-box protein n=1 Tax=Ferruginibacter paludis TaxID=1310417 RepID=UPI0025B5B8AE|nr:PAS domain S-box protein [Ferruginibacter paludis]MDN3654664.1 PAS domain S-box protein [Ferruginibacter paludis]